MNSVKKSVSLNKLVLLITIVNQKKSEFYADYIQSLGANLQFVSFGEGTADASMQNLLGLKDTGKAVIFSIIREEKQDMILSSIREKFESIKNGKGIAYTVPFSSVIGASVYNFMSDNRTIFNVQGK